MSGGSKAHETLCLNLSTRLRPEARRRKCSIYQSGMKVYIAASDAFYYPDVVTCSQSDAEDDYFVRHPSLVVEVLSPSTEALDRGTKFIDYRSLTSLQEYVLISQERIQVEKYRRIPSGLWEIHTYGPGDTLHLESLDYSCTVDDLYEDVRLSRGRGRE